MKYLKIKMPDGSKWVVPARIVAHNSACAVGWSGRMKERPILFNGEMVRAILDGRKTQTRRVCKLTEDGQLVIWKSESVTQCTRLRDDGPYWSPYGGSPYVPMPKSEYAQGCPYGQPGDELWVRERFCAIDLGMPTRTDILPVRSRYDLNEIGLLYHADERCHITEYKWKPSIHMPRWASRIQLRIKDVRVERVQEITEADARAEGCQFDGHYFSQDGHASRGSRTAVQWFAKLWDSINANRKDKGGNLLHYSWADNPWVWVVGFEKIDQHCGKPVEDKSTQEGAKE